MELNNGADGQSDLKDPRCDLKRQCIWLHIGRRILVR
jgi:hypothetical protein